MERLKWKRYKIFQIHSKPQDINKTKQYCRTPLLFDTLSGNTGCCIKAYVSLEILKYCLTQFLVQFYFLFTNTTLPHNLLTHPNWNQAFQSFPWPQLYKNQAPKLADCYKHLWKNESEGSEHSTQNSGETDHDIFKREFIMWLISGWGHEVVH